MGHLFALKEDLLLYAYDLPNSSHKEYEQPRLLTFPIFFKW